MELKDVEKLAELARIDIPSGEKKELLKDLQSILEYVGQIEAVPSAGPPQAEKTTQKNAKEYEPMLKNVFREDKEPHESGKFTKELMKEVPAEKDGYVKVKKIL